MTYWVKRIILKNGELVTERELKPEENLFGGLPPVAGDRLKVTCAVGSLKRLWSSEDFQISPIPTRKQFTR
jgi:hypothetical protein